MKRSDLLKRIKAAVMKRRSEEFTPYEVIAEAVLTECEAAGMLPPSYAATQLRYPWHEVKYEWEKET